MRPGRGGAKAWPNEAQELLLHAALGEGQAAVDAWERWSGVADLDTLDAGSQRLLPLLYRSLLAAGVEDAQLTKVKGVYRQSWYRNQVLLDRGAAAIRGLTEAGIDTLVLKGAALAAAYYRDAGVRPMQDFDLLVRRADALRAMEILRSLGWRSHEARPEAQVTAWHAALFVDPGQRELDLHWDALWQVADEQRFWAEAVDVSLNGTPTRALGHADQLVHVCVHGLRFGHVEPIRWLADAVTVIRVAGPALDWDAVVRAARERRLALATGRALAYLRDVLGASVPDEAVAALSARSHPLFERIVFSASMGRPHPLRTLAILWDRHRRLARANGNGSSPGFATYLTGYWGLERRSEIPLQAVRKLRARRWRQWR